MPLPDQTSDVNTGTLFVVLSLPFSNDPQISDILMTQARYPNGVVSLFYNLNGILSFSIEPDNEQPRLTTYQPILVIPGSTHIYAMRWTPQKIPEFFIDGIPISAGPAKVNTPLYIPGDRKESRKAFSYIRHNRPSNCSTPNEFFLSTVEELSEKIHSNREYDLIKSFGIIRQLLMDAASPVNMITTPNKPKLKFEVMLGNNFPEDLTPNIHIASIFPPNMSIPTEQISRDNFLRRKLLRANNKNYTVQDIIEIIANKLGAIHLEHRASKESLEFMAFKEALISELGSPVLDACRQIGFCILNALEPFVRHIESEKT